MPPVDRPERAVIVIRAWLEDDADQDNALRGSISTLNGSRTLYFIGLSQLIERVTLQLRGVLGEEMPHGQQ